MSPGNPCTHDQDALEQFGWLRTLSTIPGSTPDASNPRPPSCECIGPWTSRRAHQGLGGHTLVCR